MPALLTAVEYAETSCDCAAASPGAMGPHGVPENAPAVALRPAEALDTLYVTMPWTTPHRLAVVSCRGPQHNRLLGRLVRPYRPAHMLRRVSNATLAPGPLLSYDRLAGKLH